MVLCRTVLGRKWARAEQATPAFLAVAGTREKGKQSPSSALRFYTPHLIDLQTDGELPRPVEKQRQITVQDQWFILFPHGSFGCTLNPNLFFFTCFAS